MKLQKPWGLRSDGRWIRMAARNEAPPSDVPEDDPEDQDDDDHDEGE